MLGVCSHRRNRRSADGRDPMNGPIDELGEEDFSLPAPRARQEQPRRLADPERNPSGGVDLFEPSSSEVTEQTAVGRPERGGRTLGSGQRPGREGLDRTDPEDPLSGVVLRGEREIAAVRRNGEDRISGVGLEEGAARRRDGEEYRLDGDLSPPRN